MWCQTERLIVRHQPTPQTTNLKSVFLLRSSPSEITSPDSVTCYPKQFHFPILSPSALSTCSDFRYHIWCWKLSPEEAAAREEHACKSLICVTEFWEFNFGRLSHVKHQGLNSELLLFWRLLHKRSQVSYHRLAPTRCSCRPDRSKNGTQETNETEKS